MNRSRRLAPFAGLALTMLVGSVALDAFSPPAAAQQESRRRRRDAQEANRDGIGDFVHESQTLFENMMDKEPKLRLFLFSPAQQAIEFVGRALPTIRPEPKFTDEVPLMSPPPASRSRWVTARCCT